MKISKEQLKQMIKEELDQATTTPPESAKPPENNAGAEPEEKTKTDVQRMIQYIDRINSYQEYGQLLQKILAHDVKGKEMIMKRILGSSVTSAIMKKLSGSN